MTNQSANAPARFPADGRPAGLAAALVLVVCALAAWTGAVPTRAFGHDTFFLLDNAWREVCGQRVHVDYSSPWGPVAFLVVSLGLRLADFHVEGIAYANALFGLAAAGWGWVLVRHRLDRRLALVFPCFLAALAVAPYALGYGMLNTTRGMLYNRYGYVLLALIAVECFAPDRRGEGQGRELRAGLSSGSLAALLLFLKVSYFLAAGLLVASSFAVIRNSWQRLVGGLLGFAVVSLAMLAHLDFDVAAILADLHMAAGAKASSLSAGLLVERFLPNAGWFALCLWLGARAGALGEEAASTRPRFLIAAAAIVGADYFLMVTNQQPGQFPLCALLGLLAIDRSLRVAATAPEGEPPVSPRLVLGVGAMLFLLVFVPDLVGIAEGARLKLTPGDLAKVLRFDAPRLESLILYDHPSDPRSNGSDYVRYVNEGRKLLLEHRRPGEKVLNIDMMNPFPYVLGEEPPRGGVAAAAYRYTLSDEYHPSNDAFFGNADLVTVPKKPSSRPEYYDGFLRLYEPALRERYRLVAETDLWYLYRLR